MRRAGLSAACVALCLACTALSSCASSGETSQTGTVGIYTAEQTSASAADESSVPPQTTAQQTEPVVSAPLPHYSETDIGETEYEPQECSVLYEAESGTLSGYAAAASARSGYSGDGYVSGISLPDSKLTIELEIDSPQHYSITVCAASDSPVEGVLYVDGLARGRLYISGSGEFEAVKYENIYLKPDSAVLSIEELTGECDVDFVLLENSAEIYEHDYSVMGELCSENSSDSAARLYKYLCEMYGEETLSGQQCTQGSNAEIEAVAGVTGRYPAIRFGELMGYSADVDTGDIELAMEYAADGGIVGYVWNWMQNGSCYADKSGFLLANAVTDEDVSQMSPDELSEALEDERISPEAYAVIDGIDKIAAQLKRLADADIPVLFRPLPQAGNSDFWWNSDRESYLWLYETIYQRLEDYHQLDNLIWVWSAYDTEWYVGDDMCDIVSLDIYDFSHEAWDNQSYITAMLRLYELFGSKPLAISECNVLPAPANMVRDNAMWLYTSVWSGEYTLGETGGLSYDYISEAEWIVFYNCSAVIAKDELNQ